MARRIAVLTGDVIDSRKVNDGTQLYKVLDATLAALAERHLGRGQRYRGDGFQLVLADAGKAMKAAIQLRAALIRHSEPKQRWDARIAIAVGEDDWQAAQAITDADGEVFVRSGQALDAMDTQHLALSLPEVEHDDCLSLVTRFVDDLVDGWSRYSAEIVNLSLQQSATQQVLAEQLGIRQPSVHKRLRAARWALLADTLACFEKRLADSDSRS
ncbi:hypothetical protein KG088_00945 [Halomonas sp. TRM85114]|uniref:SatD family protein n=1 Tax=Halomonas jincaotanensis TaxID=2810616 RepID=UPI001BD41804|nr:SatD family protein [Halomonas jincaotanensis]MBS9402194.1 hypothetical protein [Halomonas jincaotanensis]